MIPQSVLRLRISKCAAGLRDSRSRWLLFSCYFGELFMSAVEDTVSTQLLALVRATLDIGSDVRLDPEADLIAEVGLDSIEAFEVLAALHALLGTKIPKDIDPLTVRSIRGLSEYVQSRFSRDSVDNFLRLDVASRMAVIRSADTLE
jgi:acyl carrier protein